MKKQRGVERMNSSKSADLVPEKNSVSFVPISYINKYNQKKQIGRETYGKDESESTEGVNRGNEMGALVLVFSWDIKLCFPFKCID